MKNIQNFFLVTFLLLSLTTFAQKVKFKDNKASIDNNQVFGYVKEGNTMVLATLSGKEFVSILTTSYEEKNPAHYRPHGENFPAMRTMWVYTVKFLQSGREMVTDMQPRDLVKALHQSKMVVEEGIIDEEQLKLFINKYNNENLKYKL